MSSRRSLVTLAVTPTPATSTQQQQHVDPVALDAATVAAKRYLRGSTRVTATAQQPLRSKQGVATEESERFVGSEILDSWSTIKPTANATEISQLATLIQRTHGVRVHPTRIDIYLQRRRTFMPKPRHGTLPAAAVELWQEYYATHGKPDWRNEELVKLLLMPLQETTLNGRPRDAAKNKEALQSWFRYQARKQRKNTATTATSM